MNALDVTFECPQCGQTSPVYSLMEDSDYLREWARQAFASHHRCAARAPFEYVNRIEEYGLVQQLSRPIRCF